MRQFRGFLLTASILTGISLGVAPALAEFKFIARPIDFGPLPEELVLAIASVTQPTPYNVAEEIELGALIERQCGFRSKAYLRALQALNGRLFPAVHRSAAGFSNTIPSNSEIILPGCVQTAPTSQGAVKYTLRSGGPWEIAQKMIGTRAGGELVRNAMKSCVVEYGDKVELCGGRLLPPGTVVSLPKLPAWTLLTVREEYAGIKDTENLKLHIANLLHAQGFSLHRTSDPKYTKAHFDEVLSVLKYSTEETTFVGTQSASRAQSERNKDSCEHDAKQKNFNTQIWKSANISVLSALWNEVSLKLKATGNPVSADRKLTVSILDNGVFWRESDQSYFSLPEAFRSVVAWKDPPSSAVLYGLRAGFDDEADAAKIELINTEVEPEQEAIKSIGPNSEDAESYDLAKWLNHGTYVGAAISFPLIKILGNLSTGREEFGRREINFRAADLTNGSCPSASNCSLIKMANSSAHELTVSLLNLQVAADLQDDLKIINVSYIVQAKSEKRTEELRHELSTRLFDSTMNALTIAAAGNSSGVIYKNILPQALADYSKPLITVAASDYGNKLASFSNFGNSLVSILAPGCEVPIDYWIAPDIVVEKLSNRELIGTSFAAPLVSATSALIGALPLRWPEKSGKGENQWPIEIKRRLLASTDPISNHDGDKLDPYVGVLNPVKALASVAFDVIDWRPSIDNSSSTRRISWGVFSKETADELEICETGVHAKDILRFVRKGDRAYIQRVKDDKGQMERCKDPRSDASVSLLESGHVDFDSDTGKMTLVTLQSPVEIFVLTKSMDGLITKGTPDSLEEQD